MNHVVLRLMRLLFTCFLIAGIIFHSVPVMAQSPVPDLLGWGYNGEGQASIPTDFTNTKSAAAGWFHNLALKTDGTVYAWGMNIYGQLGFGTADTDPHPIPEQVAGLSDVTVVAAGSYHSMVIRQDGTVWVWGNNNQGQLGDGSTEKSYTPKQVTGLGGTGVARSIAGGWGHSLVALSDGTVWAWGLNQKGQIGLTSAETSMQSYALQEEQGESIFTESPPFLSNDILFDASIGEAALTSSAMSSALNSPPFYSPTPIQVPVLDNIASVSSGYYHSIALRSDGTVWTWGDNQAGQLGLGYADTVSHPTPQMVPGLNGVTAIAAGYWHSLALKSDGTLWAWGRNVEGQLGNGNTANQYSPVQVTVVTRPVRSIAAGAYHNLAVLSDRSVAGWGWNQHSQTVTPQGVNNASRVAAGFAHSLVLLLNLPPWDVNNDGVINVLDLSSVGSCWGQTGTPGWIPQDVNQDGIINVLDLAIIGSHWGAIY